MSGQKEYSVVREAISRWPGVLITDGDKVQFAPHAVAKAIFIRTPSPRDRLWNIIAQMLITKNNTEVVDVFSVLVEEVIKEKLQEAAENGVVVVENPTDDFMRVGARLGWGIEVLGAFLSPGETWAGRVLQ